MKEINKLEDLKGLEIEMVTGLEEGSESVVFTFTDGNTINMYHEQDCCEYVVINGICGDVSDLVGGLVVDFREDTSEGGDPPEGYSESWTWTFYNITTTKGSVNIRWLGESNGYYSESVTVSNPNKPKGDSYWNDKAIN